MHRFFVNTNQIIELEEKIIITDKEDVNHLVKALRVKLGEEIEISDKESYEYIGQVVEMDRTQVVCKILNKTPCERESNLNITLFQGIPKSGKMDLIVQKSVELGVSRIVPLKTKRVVSVFKDKKSEEKKLDRWQKISDEAAKQSKRGRLPVVDSAITIQEICKIIGQYDLLLVAYEKASELGLKSELRRLKGSALKIGILVGPEGGLTEEEVDQMVEAGAVSITLGKRILRTETAGLTCLSVVQYELGDLSPS